MDKLRILSINTRNGSILFLKKEAKPLLSITLSTGHWIATVFEKVIVEAVNIMNERQIHMHSIT